MPTADCDKLHKLADALCATEQQDIITAAVTTLEAYVDGAAALRFARQFEGPLAESIHDLLAAIEHRRKGGR